MKKILLIYIGISTLMACQEKNTIETEKTPEEATTFEMYKMSEMAVLMEQMYVDNERLKAKIKNGAPIGSFPKHYAKIQNATMTDAKEMDAFFKEHANLFLDSQKKIYENPKQAKEFYNEGIDACIKCHEVKCGGPIPKIKKLYLK